MLAKYAAHVASASLGSVGHGFGFVLINGIPHEQYAKLEYGRLLWRVPAYRERCFATGATLAIRRRSALPHMKPK